VLHSVIEATMGDALTAPMMLMRKKNMILLETLGTPIMAM
jgi:hypothetical protein